MRPTTLFALLLLSFHLPAVAESDFSGAWVAQLCPTNVEPESGKCSTLVLELLQREDRLCGSHMFATAGAAEMDEGAPPSFIGEVIGEAATAIAISGRGSPPPRLRVELEMQGETLRWKMLDKPAPGQLLPRSARLKRAKGKTLFAPLFAQELKALCTLNFNTVMRQQTIAGPGSPTPSSTPSPTLSPASSPSPR